MNKEPGVAYIGFGGHCNQSHVPYLPSSESTIVGVADLDDASLEAAKASGEISGNAIFTNDYHELLADNATDAVIITTGDAWHFRIAEDALQAGKHVLVEKPAAATITELAKLPALFDLADEKNRRLWVCHPREFGDGPWSQAAKLLGNASLLSEAFAVGTMGSLRELRYDCLYTMPSKTGLHASFADDKLNHTIVSALRTLPETIGFENAVLLDNDSTQYDARMVTLPEDQSAEKVVVRASGRRTAHTEHHQGGVYRDWIEAVFDEGVVRVEPSLGRIALTYGKVEQDPIRFDTSRLYDGMFGAFNRAFIDHVRNPQKTDPLTNRTKILGTAAAILMQQPGFDGVITEHAVRQLTV